MILIIVNAIITNNSGIKALNELATLPGTFPGILIVQPFFSITENIFNENIVVNIPTNNPIAVKLSTGNPLPASFMNSSVGVKMKNATRAVTMLVTSSMSNALPKLFAIPIITKIVIKFIVALKGIKI